MLPNKEKNRFYNPIKQNKTHIRWLREYLSEESIPLYSFIVFSERCELKKITVSDEGAPVIKRDRLYAAVRNIWDQAEDVVSEDKIDELYLRLKELTKVSKQIKKEHVERIHEKLKDKEVKPSDCGNTCPRCGSALVLRTAKKGDNAGNQFWGCSAFPRCRYVRDL